MRKLSLFGFAAPATVLLACSGTGTDEPTRGPGLAEPPATAPTQSHSTEGDKPRPADDGKRVVVFEVTGKGISKATSVTYGVDGNTSQANGAKLPWRKQATSTEEFLLLSLVAQSGSSGDGTITCRITVDGKVVVENSSQGAYAVVTCTETA